LRVLVNIRGCNGAGKSTIPMMMGDDPNTYEESVHGAKGGAPYITIYPQLGWLALGTYHGKTGGMDTFKNNEMTKLAFDYAWKKYPQYDIVMEGVIASTVKSTYKDLFKDYEGIMGTDYVERKIIIMNFLPPVETCIARVYDRNGGKPIKEEQVRSKWRTVNRNALYFKEHGFTSLRLDTSKFPREEMLGVFFKMVERYRKVVTL